MASFSLTYLNSRNTADEPISTPLYITELFTDWFLKHNPVAILNCLQPKHKFYLMNNLYYPDLTWSLTEGKDIQILVYA